MLTRKYADERLEAVRKRFFDRGDMEGTLRGYEAVLEECERQGAEEDALAVCCRDAADILYELGRREDAFAMYDRALNYAVSDLNIRAQTLMNKGISLAQEGRTEETMPLMREASETAFGKLKAIAGRNYQLLLDTQAGQEKIKVELQTPDEALNE